MGRGALTTILAEDEVQLLVRRLMQFAAEHPGMPPQPRAGVEAMIRFRAVAEKCKEQRELRGGTIKGVAGLLKVPQARIKEIEEGRTDEIQPGVLSRYLDLLELGEWYRRWTLANPKLAARLEAASVPGAPRKMPR